MVDLDYIDVFLLTVVICFGAFYIFTDTRKKKYPPGPWGFPVVGHLPFLDKYSEKTFQRWRKIYGDVFSMRTGNWKTIVLNGYDVIKSAADYEGDVFSDRINFTTFNLMKDLNDGVYTLTSSPFCESYLQARKIATKALGVMTRTRNPIFTDVISSSAKLFYTSVLSKKDNSMISLDSDIHKAVGTIIYKIVYGRGHDKAKVDEQVQLIVNLAHESLEVQGCGSPADVLPWFRYLIPNKMAKLTKVFTNVQKAAVIEVLGHKRTFVEDRVGDITDYFVDYERKTATPSTTKDPVCDLLYNGLKEMFGAGFETSCTTLKWLFLYMIAFPEVQDKVQKEIDDIVGTTRDIDLGDKKCLPYTMAVVQEVMRLTSIVPFAIPHRALRDVEFMGYSVDEGTYVLFNLHSINYEKDYWGDPEDFRPERLLDDNGLLDKTKCKRIVPFSLGRRRCVGERLARMQVFLLFATLMQHCRLTKPEGDIPDLTPIPNLIYAPKPYLVIVKDRYKSSI